jgi:membrane protease subunit (stomatin/prohibitin family)
MGMVGGDMGRFMQYQTAQAIPKLAEGVGAGGDGGLAGAGMGMGAGMALGQVLAQNMQSAMPGRAATAGVAAEDVMSTLEKLGELKAKGVLTDDEFSAKKAELLKKLV